VKLLRTNKRELHKLVDDLPEDLSLVLKGILDDLVRVSIEDRFWLNARFVSLPPYDWGEAGLPVGKSIIYENRNILFVEKEDDTTGQNNVIAPGDLVLIALKNITAEKQELLDLRPAIVVACPKINLRFPVIIVVPLTTQPVPQIMDFPQMEINVPKNSGALTLESIALIDQLRSVDIDIVQAYLGSLDKDIFENIRQSILELLQQ
jgi:mRNA interferase MazF